MDNRAAALREQMGRTLTGLTDKLDALEHQVLGSVKTVSDSVNTVRDSLDVKLQVRRRPWTLLAGVTALGFLGGYRSLRHRAGPSAQKDGNNGASPVCAVAAGRPCTCVGEGANGAAAAPATTAVPPGWFITMGNRFQPEITAVRGVAIGVLLELVREVLTKPPSPARAAKCFTGGDGEHSAPGKPRTKRRAPSSRLHPLEGLRDAKAAHRPR